MESKTPLYYIYLFVVVLLVAGCSGGGNPPVYPGDIVDDIGTSRFIVASLGGTVEATGARVYIPPGALPADTEITIKVLAPGSSVGNAVIAGGVEITPHLVDLNGPILIEFTITPGMFKGWSFPQGQYWGGAAYQPLVFQDGTPSYAIISDDTSNAMMSTDHLSVFALLASQANDDTDNVDVVLSALEKIDLRGGGSYFYDDDILIDQRMKYYLGGWPQVYGSEGWLPTLFDFAHPGEVVEENLRFDIYREVFGDLLLTRSFGDRFNTIGPDGEYVYSRMMTSVDTLFTALKGPDALMNSWVTVDGANDYYAIMDHEMFEGYTFMESLVTREMNRADAVRQILNESNARGEIPSDIWSMIETNGLDLTNDPSSTIEFLNRISCDTSTILYNCDVLESLMANASVLDPDAVTAASVAIFETREAVTRSDVIFAEAIIAYMIMHPTGYTQNNGINLCDVFDNVTTVGISNPISSPLSYGVFFNYLTSEGCSEYRARQIAHSLAWIDTGSVTYGLEKYMDGMVQWDPIAYARNLQRVTLVGNLAREIMDPDVIAGFPGESGVATKLAFGEVMRSNMGYIYSRLKYNAWNYLVETEKAGRYSWMANDSPWQTNNTVMEFDPGSEIHFRTESNRHLNENLYQDIIDLYDLEVPTPDPGPGLIIIID